MTPYYQDDWVTLYCGDARALAPMLAPECDVLITDPPYGVNLGSRKDGRAGYDLIDDSPEFVREVVVPIVAGALQHVKRGLVYPGTRSMFFYPPPEDVGAVFLPWGAGFARWGFCASQPILFYGKDPNPMRKSPNSFMPPPNAGQSNGHPCPKPLEWMTWAVGKASMPGEVIFDPFAGSGTTLRAAKDMGRHAIGIELSPVYCEIAVWQLAQDVLPLGW